MKQIKSGSILISTTISDDDLFGRSTILIAEQNENGYVGFIFNKPFERTLNELAEFSRSKPFKIFFGGPVETEHLFFIHRRPDLIADGMPVSDTIFLNGNFSQALHHINEGTLSEDDIKIFIGYCGWDSGQLENEVNEGFWLVDDTNQDIIFSKNVTMIWGTLSYKNDKN